MTLSRIAVLAPFLIAEVATRGYHALFKETLPPNL